MKFKFNPIAGMTCFLCNLKYLTFEVNVSRIIKSLMKMINPRINMFGYILTKEIQNVIKQMRLYS